MKTNKSLLILLILILVFNVSFADARPAAKNFPTRSIIIGSYVIDYKSLDPKTIALAQASVESSGQKKIYYKSDLTSQKIWVDITNGESISDISDKSSNIISDSVINALPLTHWIKVDGSVVVFGTGEVKSINDMHTLLDPRTNELLQKLTIDYDLAKNLFEADDEDAVSEMTKNILIAVLMPLSQATIEGYDKQLASWDALTAYLASNGGSDTAVALVSAEKQAAFTNREIAVNNALLGRLNGAANVAVKNGLNALNGDIWESIGKVEAKIAELQDSLNSDKSSFLAIYRGVQEQKLLQAIQNKDYKTAEAAIETIIHADHISAGLILDKPAELQILTITFGESIKNIKAIAAEGKGVPYYTALKNGEPATTLKALTEAQLSKLKEAISEFQLIIADIIARLDQPEAQQNLLSQAVEEMSKALDAVPKDSDAMATAATTPADSGADSNADSTTEGTDSTTDGTSADNDGGSSSGDGSGTAGDTGSAGDAGSSGDAGSAASGVEPSTGSDAASNGDGTSQNSASGTGEATGETSGDGTSATGGASGSSVDGASGNSEGSASGTGAGSDVSDEASLVSAQSPADLLSNLKEDFGDQLNAIKALNDPETTEQLNYLEALKAKNDNLYKTFLGALENNDTALADEIKANMAVVASQQDALYSSFASLYKNANDGIAALEAKIADNGKLLEKAIEPAISELSTKNEALEAQISNLKEDLAKFALLLDPTDKQLLDLYTNALKATENTITEGDPIAIDDALDTLLTLSTILSDALKSNGDFNDLTSLLIKAAKEAYLANLEDQGDALLALTAKLTPDQIDARLALANDAGVAGGAAGIGSGGSADATAGAGTAGGAAETGAGTDATAATGTAGDAAGTGTGTGANTSGFGVNLPSMLITQSDSGQYILVRVPTLEIQGITYVPIKTFYNLFDIEVIWHPETVSVEVKGLMQTEIFIEDSKVIQKDDLPTVMDYPMKIIGGVSYAPIAYYTTDMSNFIMPNISNLTLIIIPLN